MRITNRQKYYFLCTLSQALTMYLKRKRPYAAKTFITFCVIGQLIKQLNYLTRLPGKNMFKPINKYNVSPQCFVDWIKSLDKENKYIVDNYTFHTKDGYVLTTFRIFLNGTEKSKLTDKRYLDKPALLIHGFTSSAIGWFYSTNTISFHLVNKGFDVWVINLRGNIFNQNHSNPKITAKDFFDYTFHIHGEVDIPTAYENILRITKKEKIYLIANSFGGIYTLHSLMNELTTDYMNKHTERVIMTCPCIFSSYTTDPYVMNFKYTMKDIDSVLEKADELGIYHFGTGNWNSDSKEYLKVIKWAERKYGGYDYNKSDLCFFNGIKDNFMEAVAVPELHNYFLPLQRFFGGKGCTNIGGGYGMSFKAYYSWMQYGAKRIPGLREARIYKYDFGKERNLKVYNTEESPDYNLTNVKVPMDILIGERDLWFTVDAANDFANIVNDANKNTEIKVHFFKGFHHVTFSAPRKNVTELNEAIDQILV